MNQKIVVNDKVVGILHGKCLGYFHSKTPDSPFSNFFYVPKGFKVYFHDIDTQSNKTIMRPVYTPNSHVGKFYSVEQLFAFGKAMTCHDKKMADKIYSTHSKDGKEYKYLGRKVRNYDDKLWQSVSKEWMLAGMKAKFMQDQYSYNALTSTSDYTLIEANPYDAIWGAGVAIDKSFENAKGQNKQGRLLMQARDYVLKVGFKG